MVRLVTLFAAALSISSFAVVARPTHGLSPRHRAGAHLDKRAPKTACKAKTSSAPVASPSAYNSGSDDKSSGGGGGDDEEDTEDDEEAKSSDTTEQDKDEDENSTDDKKSGDDKKSDDDKKTDDKTDSGDDKTGGDEDKGDDDDGGLVISGTRVPFFPTDSQAWWSVADQTPKAADAKMKAFELNDDTFKITAQSRGLPRPIRVHKGKTAMLAHFKKGAYTLRTGNVPAGGLSFYSPGPKDAPFTLDGIKAREVSFGYSLMFSEGFAFNMGGKLPGLYGGVSDAIARTASGGNHNAGAWSCRFMFRNQGKGELYCYLPQNLNSMNFCGRQMNRKCAGATANGKTYGATIGTGAWKFTPGKWNTVRQVLRLNDPGKRNGSMKVYVNGDSKPIINVQNVSFGDKKENAFRGLQVQTFFGGHEPVWASPKNQDIYFSDFTLVVQDTW